MKISIELWMFMFSFGIMCAVSAVNFTQRNAALYDARRRMEFIKLEEDEDLPPLLKFMALEHVLFQTGLYWVIMAIGLLPTIFTFFMPDPALSFVFTFVETGLAYFFLFYVPPDIWLDAISYEINQRVKLSKLKKSVGKLTDVNIVGGGVMITLDYLQQYFLENFFQAKRLKISLVKFLGQEIVLFSQNDSDDLGQKAPDIIHWYVRASSKKSRNKTVAVKPAEATT